MNDVKKPPPLPLTVVQALFNERRRLRQERDEAKQKIADLDAYIRLLQAREETEATPPAITPGKDVR